MSSLSLAYPTLDVAMKTMGYDGTQAESIDLRNLLMLKFRSAFPSLESELGAVGNSNRRCGFLKFATDRIRSISERAKCIAHGKPALDMRLLGMKDGIFN